MISLEKNLEELRSSFSWPRMEVELN